MGNRKAIPFYRFYIAADRVAQRKLIHAVKKYELRDEEIPAVFKRAILPSTAATLAKRLWARDLDIEHVEKPDWGFF